MAAMQPARATSGDGGRVENAPVATAALSRRCSRCGQSGHNLRTCLEHRDSHLVGAGVALAPDNAAQPPGGQPSDGEGGSDDSSGHLARERKKGISWTEEEHRLFLLGLQKLGKGDWRGISRHYVQTRSPTQVASHAQKYFIRQSIAGKRKRRSSLFDTTFPEPDKDGMPGSGAEEQQEENAERGGSQMPGPTSDGPQFPFPMLPCMPNGADPAAAAFWYQSMLAQQHPAAMMQAMFGGNHTAAGPMNNPALAHVMASQGFMALPFMNPANFPFMPGQPPNMSAAQGQSMANGFLAQQHLAAAFALGAVPFGLNPNAGPPSHFPGFFPGFPPMTQPHAHNAEAGTPVIKEDPGKTDGVSMPEGSFQQLSGSNGQEGQPPHDGVKRVNAEGSMPRHIIQDSDATESSSQTGSGGSAVMQYGQTLQYPRSRTADLAHQFSPADNSAREPARRTQSNPVMPVSKKARWLAREQPPENFGNGTLIRPQALKACPPATPGEMPSYMSSGSGDLQSTGIRISTYEPSMGRGSSIEEGSGSASYSPHNVKPGNGSFLQEAIVPAGSSLATGTHM